MSNKLQPVRGTHDVLPDEFEKFSAIISIARELGALYGFREMATPIFEATEVFSRSMGETSDVVSKEMFTFETRGGESVTLRPEFTAGMARAFISNGMQQNLPLKLFSTGPLFRYERPQKGRQRQFHQVNYEWLGDDSWQADVEIITLAGHLLYYLSGGKGCTLHINTLGDKESREKYRAALVSYLAPFADKLSEDSKRRLNENPLRILDSKDKGDREILINAPVMTDYLSASAKARFNKICSVLQSDGALLFQEIKIDPALVRGLDYYTDTVFEFVANTGELGAQNTVLAGGRYDGLIEQMGGKSTPAIGFAAGVERLLLLMPNKEISIKDLKIGVFPLFEDDMKLAATNYIAALATLLRVRLNSIKDELKTKREFSAEVIWQGKLSKRLERASKSGFTHAIIIGDDEVNSGKFLLKDMASGTQSSIDRDKLLENDNVKKIFGI